MTHEKFNEYQKKLLDLVIEMKNTKGKEYANSDDRFGNFNRLSSRLGLTNTQVAWVYITKHLDSIESYIKNGKVYSTESIQGRILDAITYLTLIGGMAQENDDKM